MKPNSEISAMACAPSADSFLTIKEKIMSHLNNMVLIEENEVDTPPTDDEELLA
jgi:hypothetical protein